MMNFNMKPQFSTFKLSSGNGIAETVMSSQLLGWQIPYILKQDKETIWF